MFFIVLTFFAALFLEGIGSIISVIGISKLFGIEPLIIALAIALDVGKITVASLVYSYWERLSAWMKSYALLATTITMIITSAGAAGYLSGAFQQAVIGAKEGEHKVAVLKEQQARYLERKKQIDDQIAKLPERTTVNQRLRLMRGFDAEQKRLDVKIAEIDKQLPEAELTQIGVEAKAGPILYVAKAFDISVEQAVKWVILLIIFVFDPLAIFLIISGNFLWAQRKKELASKEEVASKEEAHPILQVPPIEPVNTAPSADEPIFTELRPTHKKSDLPAVEEQGSWNEDFVFHPSSDEPEAEKQTHHEQFLRDTPIQELEKPPATNSDKVVRDAYKQSGLLKPIDVELFSDGEFPNPPVKAPSSVTPSSLGSVIPDPKTIVDAHLMPSFKKAQTVAITPTRRPFHNEDV